MVKPLPADSAPLEANLVSAIDKRKHARVETCNLISYTYLDDSGHALKQGMGRALDISQNGLLLECGMAAESPLIALMSADPQDRLIEICGHVVHSRRTDDGNYRIGVQFINSNLDENIRFATNLIKSFHYPGRKRT